MLRTLDQSLRQYGVLTLLLLLCCCKVQQHSKP